MPGSLRLEPAGKAIGGRVNRGDATQGFVAFSYCVLRPQSRARAAGKPPDVRNTTPNRLNGYIVLSGLPPRIRSYQQVQRLRLSFPIAHGLLAREQEFRPFAVIRP